ncbi:MAG: stage III sporulation protein AB [Clostridiales bacterium]|nr:stage III sporulation protein AB [Clostridiales bacterium]
MLKLTGAVCVLTACIGYAAVLTEKQKNHREVLLSLIRIMNLLADKIRYERMTMAEALGGLNRKYRGPAGDVLNRIAEKLREDVWESLEMVWRFCFKEKQRELFLTDEEMDIVLETGKNLGYLDVEAQAMHLLHCRERLEQKLYEAEKEMAEKQKIYRCLAVAAGVMVILVLV